MKQNLLDIFLFCSFQIVCEAKKGERTEAVALARQKKKNVRFAHIEIVFALLDLMLALRCR